MGSHIHNHKTYNSNRLNLYCFGQFCHPNYLQNYCALFPTRNHYSCDVMLGSPVTCGDQWIVAGFLINNGSCTQRDGQFLLNYHSVGDFQRWILMMDVSDSGTGSGVVKQLSVLVAMIAVIINLMWGTEINIHKRSVRTYEHPTQKANVPIPFSFLSCQKKRKYPEVTEIPEF